MISRLLIFLIFLSLESKLYSQTVLPSKVYCAYENACGFDGEIEENIVVEFSKGIAKITSYYSTCQYMYNSVLQVTYVGAYYIIGDTIKVRLINKSSELRSKIPRQGLTTMPDASDSFMPYSNLSFVIRGNSLVPISNFLPVLAISSEAGANDLALRFAAMHANIKTPSLVLQGYKTKSNFTGDK